jgi:phospholipid/cholesterol/gamma-HCH transport system ATP-binding protein
MDVETIQQALPPVEVCGLIASYGDKIVLEGVDFTAHPHQITVILGGSGCGKSTLLRHILGLLPHGQGEVRLFGTRLDEVSEAGLKNIRTRIGVLFQNGALFTSMSIGENIALVLREKGDLPEELIPQLVRMKLAQVGLEDALQKHPDELSGGMRKRAALARALALDPQILFCDEPSAGLDPVVAAELDDLLLRLRDIFHMTIVVVTHDLDSIRRIADRVVMLHAGRVIAAGTLAEVQANANPLVSDFFGRRPRDTEATGGSLYSLFDAKGLLT